VYLLVLTKVLTGNDVERNRFVTCGLDLTRSGQIFRYECWFLYNKTHQMHQFPNFTPAWNSTCFGHFLCPSSGVYSL